MKFIFIFFLLIVGNFIFAQNIANLPIPNCAGTAEVYGDSIYYFGGASRWAGTIRYQIVYKYDGTDWSYYDSIPDNNVWGIESVLAGDDVYIFAGWPSGARNVRKYNLLNKNWTYLNQSPNASNYGITADLVNEKIYLFIPGGKVYEYNILTNEWNTKKLNDTVGFPLSSAKYNNEIYVAGFYDSAFYKYSPALDEWTRLANMPFQISRCAMQVIDGKIYCAGGSEQGSPQKQNKTLLEYDIASDKWSIDKFEISERRVWMADVIYKDKFFVLGGFDTTSVAVDIVEEITPLGIAVSLEENSKIILGFSLSQNYPNPFNPITKIRYTLTPSLSLSERVSEGRERVQLKVYDILGNEIAALVNEYQQPGTYEVEFDGSKLSSGIYFYRLQAGGFLSTKKLILLK